MAQLLAGLFGGARGRPAGFPKTLNAVDLNLSTDPCPNTTSWFRIGHYTVPAQQQLAVGYGDADHASNQGYLYIDIHDAATGAQIEGKIRIGITNANETSTFIVFEERTEVLRGSLSDKAQKIAFPEQRGFPRVGEDSMIILEIMEDAAETADPAVTTILVPVTVYQ
jgi:hypothetical protein